MMRESGDCLDTPPLDFKAWQALLPWDCGGQVKVSEPKAFSGWIRPLSVCGFAAAAMKVQCGLVALNVGCHAHRLERTSRDARLDSADHYLIVYQVAGQGALTQNDEAVQLAVGDVAIVDKARPVAYFISDNSAQWLSLRLPRKAVTSHLGFEPQGGLSRHGQRAGRLLFDLVRGADDGDGPTSSPAASYLQLAVYDLVGALFAPSDPWLASGHANKLFTRICAVIKDACADPNFGPCQAAVATGISLRYLQKLFTQRGSTCSEFIYSVRLDHAARLLHRRALLGTNQSLSEIAYSCGFHDYTHFARKFRQRFGCAPSAHAEEHRVRAGNNARHSGESAS